MIKTSQDVRKASSIDIKPLYGPEAAPASSYDQKLGYPGQPPYTRGIQPTMYRGRFWTMRQYAGFGTAEETNRRYHHLLKNGQTGLSVAFDLPTQMGYDSDHPRAEGEVGRAGVAISCVDDMERLFDKIDPSSVTVSMTINATAAILLAMYVVVAKRRGVSLDRLGGTLQNDILKEYIARATYIYPPTPSLRLTADIIAYTGEHMPQWNPISIGGYHMREAGATAAQEIAFTMANACVYADAVCARGIPFDVFAPRLSFFFAVHNHFLEEVAKFRLARRMWAKIAQERYGTRSPRSLALRMHAQTAGSTLTAQQPHNNIVRVTLQAMAAVLGGVQSLHTNSFDEALALPTEEAVTLALRTQQILAHESDVANTVDPVGGSYAIEAMTDALEEEVDKYLREIGRQGGMIKAIESGYVKQVIEQSAYDYQRMIERGDLTIVGVNRFAEATPDKVPVFRVPRSIGASRRKQLGRFRKIRSSSRVNQTLARLREAAQGSDNMVPVIIEAVEAKATLGEISDVFREVFGVYSPL